MKDTMLLATPAFRDRDRLRMDYIKLALEAYNSPHRHNFILNGQSVSNLDAVLHYLTYALDLADSDETADILMTMANMHSFQGKIDEAITGYNRALLKANQWQQTTIHTYLAIWHHYQGNLKSMTKHLGYLEELYHLDQISHLEQVTRLKKQYDKHCGQTIGGVIEIIENVLAKPICYRCPASSTDTNSPHAIVTLGYKLKSDGSIALPLKLRLEKTLELATQNPESLIVVTGGLETVGVTEAEQMQRWLEVSGVDNRRIIKEDKATNTIENAQNSLALLQAKGIKAATLVSASIHVHRSQVLFETVQHKSQQLKLNSNSNSLNTISFDHIAVQDRLSQESFPYGQTRINCYIDALRGYGMSAFKCGGYRQV